ncbi:hypothetical protein [Streptomyces sp. NPDC013171]|uniref:hypothetical protein n=1 Tax=Streptomyces sp. NPDC013171 TaxID=3364863 RepID=UPI0036C8CF23
MPALFVSLMRTAVPAVAGWLLGLAAWAGLDLDTNTVAGAVTVLCTVAYYVLFRLLEIAGQHARGTTLQRLAGIMLGWARPPQYPTPGPVLPPVAVSPFAD